MSYGEPGYLPEIEMRRTGLFTDDITFIGLNTGSARIYEMNCESPQHGEKQIQRTN